MYTNNYAGGHGTYYKLMSKSFGPKCIKTYFNFVIFLSYLLQRLRISAETSDRGAEGRSYCSIGNCLRSMIQPEKAIECYTRVSN